MFGKQLNSEEWQGYTRTIQTAKDKLDIHNLGLIAPVRCLPSDPETGIGSLPGAKAFFKFVQALGFDMVQVDPEGKTKLVDPSPYTGTVFSTNPMTINLQPLAEDPAWAGLLSRDTLKDVVQNNPKKDGARVAYRYVFEAQDKALAEVYSNFKDKLTHVGTLSTEEGNAIRALNEKFEAFKSANKSWLEPDALYEALTAEYQNDYYPAWKGPNADLDRHLMSPRDAAEKAKAEARIAELKQRHADVFGNYEFSQFIASEQKTSFNEFSARTGVNVMADRQVGFSDRDVWAYQKLFLKDWSLGCPPDYYAKGGQAWGFPVLDPEKLFNPDGSLGEAGQLMKRLFEKIFEENPGGVRIDHIIGLIDPWVYPAKDAVTTSGGRLYSSPEHPVLKKYALIGQSALDENEKSDAGARVKDDAIDSAEVDRYARILDRIVLAAAKEKGVSMRSVICEDLGTLTTPVIHVMRHRGLSGIRVTQFANPNDPHDIYRGRNVEPHHWIAGATHDNEPLLSWWDTKLIPENQVEAHARQLADDLVPDAHERPNFVQRLVQDKLAFVRTKLAELFAGPSKHVLVFFADMLGMQETYNVPGTTGDKNWSLRIPKDYQEAYFQAVKEGRGLNLPEALLTAMKARKIEDPALEQELSRYAEILKK